MKYFKDKTPTSIEGKNNVGSSLNEGPGHIFSDKERRMRQIEASIKMNRNKMGRLFSSFTREELKSPGIFKPDKDDEQTN